MDNPFDINRHARKLGICLFVTVNGKLFALPGDTVHKHPEFMRLCHRHKEELKSWLITLAKQT